MKFFARLAAVKAMMQTIATRNKLNKQVWVVHDTKNHRVVGVFTHYDEAAHWRVTENNSVGTILPLEPHDFDD